MRHKYFLFVVLALAAALAGMYVSSQSTDPKSAASAATQDPASPSERLFAQTLPDAHGQEQALTQWRGRSLVVNFWASWCAPCVEEMPELAELQADIADQGMQIIGIGIDSADNIREFADRHGIAYPLYVGGMDATELSRAFGNTSGGLPFTVWLQPDGSVGKTYLGRLDMAALRRDLGVGAGATAP